jgi:hypothetical protein
MVIVVHLSKQGVPVADVTYRSGLHVEIRVGEGFRSQGIDYPLNHSPNEALRGTWEQALDWYFNEGSFDARSNLFPGEIPRYGCARDHKSIFRQAVLDLKKDLEPHGFAIDVEFG